MHESAAAGNLALMHGQGSGSYRVEVDWRGETAYYIEEGRRVWVTCLYWGGPAGRVAHIHAVWEYDDGRREPLTVDEREEILRRVIDYVRIHHHIPLEVEGGRGE